MVMILPPERHYRTRTSHLAPFWEAHRVYWHAPYDDELQAAEWSGLGLERETVLALRSAGITCYRLLPPCPDWLLASIPRLGPVRLAAIRRILPYGRDIYAAPLCPGRRLENARSVLEATSPGVDAYLAEQVRREAAGEPELLGTEAVLSSFSPHEPRNAP